MDEDGKFQKGNTAVCRIGLKGKRSGETRVRGGFFVADRIMLYVSGGIACAQIQGVGKVSGTKKSANGKSSKAVSATVFDKTKTMVGFTLGGGIDFSITNHILLRAEYRYLDFGKKEFKKGYLKLGYKSNDFRVGIAYKF